MPTPAGPSDFNAAFHFSAITSKALSQEIGVKSPSLSYLPFFMRSSGWVRRSSPYMIFDRKYPLMQFSPRFTSESGSPCVATTRPFCTPTSTAHPVPQKRQTPLSQRTAELVPPSFGAATTGTDIPALAAAAAMAWVLMNSRRLIVMAEPPGRGNSRKSSAGDKNYWKEERYPYAHKPASPPEPAALDGWQSACRTWLRREHPRRLRSDDRRWSSDGIPPLVKRATRLPPLHAFRDGCATPGWLYSWQLHRK